MIGLAKRFVSHLGWIYRQYLFNTSQVILEPLECALFNFVVLSCLLIVSYSTYIFLPDQVRRIYNWLYYGPDALGAADL